MVKASSLTQEEIRSFINQGFWGDINSLDIWERNANEHSNDEVLVDSHSRLTWSDVKLLSDRIAISFIELGINRDQVIVIQLPNCVELPILRLACEKAGVLPLLAGMTLRSSEMKSIIVRSEAVGVITLRQFRNFNYVQMVEEIRPYLPTLKHIFVVGDQVPKGKLSITKLSRQLLELRYPADYFRKTRILPTEVSSIVLTSGSTGIPKLIARVGARMGAAREVIQRYKLNRGDVFGAFAPAVTGTCETHSYLTIPLVGAKIVMMEYFDVKEAFELIERERISIASVVPAQLSMMLNHPDLNSYDLTSLKCVISASAPLPHTMAEEFEKRIGCHVLNAYGTMEAPGISTTSINDPLSVRLLTVGKPYTGSEIKLVNDRGEEVGQGEVGQIMIRGPFQFAGYYRAPELNDEAMIGERWLKLSDLGRFDEQGNLIIVGRIDDVIIRGGQNIHPEEVEILLVEHPKIQNVAIIGMHDPVMGQKCCAYVVLRSNEMLAFEEMVAFLKAKGIAPYKLPERLEIIDKLPVTGGGKLDRKALRLDISQKLQKSSRYGSA